MTAIDYIGTRFGKLKIPINIYVESPRYKGFRLDDVLVEWDSNPHVLPADISVYKDGLVREKENAAKARGSPFYDGPLVRLKDFGISDENDETPILILKTQPTSYFASQASNSSLDKRILDGNTNTIKERYVKDPLLLKDPLANPIGVNISVISEADNRLVYVQRSEKVNIYPGFYHMLAAGYMNPIKDQINGKPHPLKSAQRETEEEVGIRCSPNDLKLLSLGRDLSDLHPEVICELRTPLSVEEILSAPKTSKFENLKILSVPFTPEDVLSLFKGRQYTENPYQAVGWVPAGEVGTIQSLIREFGYDKVKSTADRIL